MTTYPIDGFEPPVTGDMVYTTTKDNEGSMSSQELALTPGGQQMAATVRPPELEDGSDVLPPPNRSPPLEKGNVVATTNFPRLLNLVDSVISGSDGGSLFKLRGIVKGEEATIRTEDDSNRHRIASFVVDTLIGKMGGVKGLDKSDNDCTLSVMLSARAAIVAGEILPWLPCEIDEQESMSSRTLMAKALALVLQACTRNRAMCSAAGLLRVLLLAYETIFLHTAGRREGAPDWEPVFLLDAIQALGAHCLTVQNLREWLNIVANTCATGKSLSLLLTLERTMSGEETRGPSHSFEFDGESSGLLAPGESKWPFVNGYAVATWLYIESFADIVDTAATAASIASAANKSGKFSAFSAAATASSLAGEGTAHMPRLFSFLSVDNLGVEAYFHGQFLVVECVTGKGRKGSLHFTYPFRTRRWYFVGLEHTHKPSLLGKAESEIRLYINGSIYESRPLVFPRITRPLSFCCIGTNPPPIVAGLQKRRQMCTLFAEIGPVYIFKEPLGEKRMAQLASRGGDALPSFGGGLDAPESAISAEAVSSDVEYSGMDLELGPRLYLLYHPKLLNGRSCPDASPAGASGAHKKPAEVLGHVHVAIRTRPTEALWAVAEGGPMALLPLAVGAVDRGSMQPIVKGEISTSTALLAAPILKILSLAIKHYGIAEEVARSHGLPLLAHFLRYLVRVPGFEGSENKAIEVAKTEDRDEELLASVVSLVQAPQNQIALKVKLLSNLLLDLKIWSSCSYGLQKKVLSSLADLAFTEPAAMKGANAVQMLLDGCRSCYWLVQEPTSHHYFAGVGSSRHPGQVNDLVDEVLVVVELLIDSAQGTELHTNVCSLVRFVLECPQSNQVARVLQLIYRLVVQPQTTKADTFASMFLENRGVEMLVFLLRKQESEVTGSSIVAGSNSTKLVYEFKEQITIKKEAPNGGVPINASIDCNGSTSVGELEDLPSPSSLNPQPDTDVNGQSPLPTQKLMSIVRSLSASNKAPPAGDIGDVSLPVSADTVDNKLRNVDSCDGIMVGVVSLIAALFSGGHLKVVSSCVETSVLLSSPSGSREMLSTDGSPGVAASAVVWLLYALQKAFQAAPKQLLTESVYAALLPGVIRAENGLVLSNDEVAFFDAGHRFENISLLLVLLRALPSAAVHLQLRVLQDMLLLACTHPENRTTLLTMPEWPEWLLEILYSNYEANADEGSDNPENIEDVADLVYSYLTIMLQHSMRHKDGWKDVEAIIHCAEWLVLSGGSSDGESRLVRQELIPGLKRRLLGNLLVFSSNELQAQNQFVAAAAAGVAAEALSPETAKVEAEAVASLSMSLAENALVLLMLVEDHLRLETHSYHMDFLSTEPGVCGVSGSSMQSRTYDGGTDNSGSQSFNAGGFDVLRPSLSKSLLRRSLSRDNHGSMNIEVLASMADENGQVSAAALERLTAAAAAEPYDSVRCAFACYGTYALDLAQGWRFRSQMWYGVGLPERDSPLIGGAGGFKSWSSALKKDGNGHWIELPLVWKSITMLQALLLNQYGPGVSGGMVGMGGGAGSESGRGKLQQLLDSDQPFFAMLRVTLLALREEDKGISSDITDAYASGLPTENSNVGQKPESSTVQWNGSSDSYDLVSTRTKSSLLECVLAPLLKMQLFESRRQRVLVACSILYSEVWHSVSEDRKVLRPLYLETILPPFAALLRRWRPLLSGIHELTDSEGQSPLAVDNRPLATDVHPLEAAMAMISPAWATAFASPPAAMALAMVAAGVSGGDASYSRRDSNTGHGSSRLLQFPSFERLSENGETLQAEDEDEARREAVLAAARNQERAARIGSSRGLGAVAMATSGQRRSLTDGERAKRWNRLKAMGNAWSKCGGGFVGTEQISSVPENRVYGILTRMVEVAENMKISEARRRMMFLTADGDSSTAGARLWRSFLLRLEEMEALFGTLSNQSEPLPRVSWKLDPMENPLRMRLRLKRNYKVTYHNETAAYFKEPQESSASNFFASSSLPRRDHIFEPQEDTRDQDDMTKHLDDDKREGTPKTGPVSSSDGSGFSGLTSVLAPSVTLADGTSLNSREPYEKQILKIHATMIQPLKSYRGIFQVSTMRISFLIDYCIDTNEAYTQSMPEKEHGEGRKVDDRSQVQEVRDRHWPMSELTELHTRRFSLQRSALEFFMLDRSNYFFNFGTVEARQRVYEAIVQAKPSHLKMVYAQTQSPEKLFETAGLTDKWARREITNFEYLMHLNTLAGRSYNDMTQYPVFPWVLADYTSKELNLNEPNNYRDLSKPVGALSPTRLEKILQRFENFDDPVIPKFHYGSHYSSAGTVLYYLIRIEPYSTLAMQLQGGKFDHADRMFSDIGSTWNGVLEDMSDVKELVPELFYLPEALKNVNHIDLGQTQKGKKIGDVKLPPWARSAEDFIQKHRSALESEYISQHLNEWIDLIFGYKQKGPDAVAANNLFYYMTYEGAVDIDKISDPIIRQATQDQIKYFGQTPSQLLTIPHRKRMPIVDGLHLQTIFHNPNTVKFFAILGHADQLNLPAKELRATRESIVTVSMGAPACQVAVHKWHPNTPNGRGMPFLFQHSRPNLDASGGLMRMFSKPVDDGENHFPRILALAPVGVNLGTIVAITPDGRHLLTGGHADHSLKLAGTDTARVVESVTGHCAPITCLALSPDGSTLVTGSQDATAILWRIQGSGTGSSTSAKLDLPSSNFIAAGGTFNIVGSNSPVSESSGEGTPSAAVDLKRRRCVRGPLHVLRGHVDELLSCCVNAELDLVVSSSQTKGVLLHSVRQGRYLRPLVIDTRADIVALSPAGIIVVFDKVSRVLNTFTVNGNLITAKLLPSWEGNVSSIAISRDGLHAVIGTSCSQSLHTNRMQKTLAKTRSAEPEPSRYSSQHSPQWYMVGQCPSCGGKSRMHTPACQFSRSSEEQADFERYKAKLNAESLASDIRPPPYDASTAIVRVQSGPVSSSMQETKAPTSHMRAGISLGASSVELRPQADAKPAIILLELHTLEVLQKFLLRKGQDITAMALNDDNTNLVVSTADRQLLVVTNPGVSRTPFRNLHRKTATF